jgi:hypothetical protein
MRVRLDDRVRRTLSSMVYSPGFLGSPNSTRVVTAGNPDVPAPAVSLGSASISFGASRRRAWPS